MFDSIKKTLLTIPVILTGLVVFAIPTLAVGDGTFDWLNSNPYTYSTNPTEFYYTVDYDCVGMNVDSQNLWYQIDGGAWIDTTVPTSVQGCDAGGHWNIPMQNGDYNFKFCDTLEGIIDCSSSVTSVTFTDGIVVGGSGLPEFGEGDVDTVIAGATTAMQGILDFFVSGAGLWFTIAGALIIIYYIKRALSLRGIGTKNNISKKQKRAMINMHNRQRGLKQLRRRGY